MKLCVRRLFFLIPHLILSTFHAGIRKIFLRLVLVNSPRLFFFFFFKITNTCKNQIADFL